MPLIQQANQSVGYRAWLQFTVSRGGYISSFLVQVEHWWCPSVLEVFGHLFGFLKDAKQVAPCQASKLILAPSSLV
jgi:hypothetical protein